MELDSKDIEVQQRKQQQADQVDVYSPDNNMPDMSYDMPRPLSLTATNNEVKYKRKIRIMYLSMLICFLLVIALIIPLGVFVSRAKMMRDILEHSKDKQYRDMFEKFIDTNDKAYTSDRERQQRQENFLSNVLKLEAFFDKVNKTVEESDLSPFVDLSEEEFEINALGLTQFLTQNATLKVLSTASLPTEVDWVAKGYVTDVKLQKGCGASYIFAAVGAIESALMIKNKKSINQLSDQQVLDCTNPQNMMPMGNMSSGRVLQGGGAGGPPGGMQGGGAGGPPGGQQGGQPGGSAGMKGIGCQGGDPERVFEFAKNNSLAYSSSYPFVNMQTTCNNASTTSGYKISGFYAVPPKNLTQLQAAVAQQPVVVGIHSQSLQLLKNYTLSEQSFCSKNKVDHAVLIVGYKDGYFKVKNSWGDTFGDKGYFYVKMTEGLGVCGINNYARYPVA